LRAIYHLVLIIIISVGASVSQETDEVFRPTATQTPAAEGSSPTGHIFSDNSENGRSLSDCCGGF